MSASVAQIWNIVASRPKFDFTPTFMFCNPIWCSFLWKYILVFEKWFFSFDRSNMQIFTVNITRVVWLHIYMLFAGWEVRMVKNCDRGLENTARGRRTFYHLNLISWHYWCWQRNIFLGVNIFVRHTFLMSKSNIKTKTVLTMTDMTESTELRAWKRQKDG